MNDSFEGIGAFLHGVVSPPDGDGPPWTFEFRPEPAPEPDFVPPPAESAGWTWEQWQRFAGIGLTRDYEQRMDAALFGAGVPAVSWEHASALYDRVVAEQVREAAERRAEDTRRYWSGPNKVERQILRAFGVMAEAIGVVPRSAFSSAYRQRQRNRVKRRRR